MPIAAALPALSSAVGIAGGIKDLFGGEDNVPTPFQTASDSVTGRVRGAQSVGVHPLAALGVPSTSVATRVGDNEGRGLDRISESLKQMGQRSEQLKLQEAQLDESRARADAARAQALRDKTEASLALKQAADSSAARATQRAVSQQDMTETTTLQLPFGGRDWKTGKSSTAQEVSDQYGEPVEWLYGLMRLIDDGIGFVGDTFPYTPKRGRRGYQRPGVQRRTRPVVPKSQYRGRHGRNYTR